MPSLYKRGDTYYAGFYKADRYPQKKQVSLKVASRKAAEKKYAKLSAMMAFGVFGLCVPQLPRFGRKFYFKCTTYVEP